MAAAALFAYLAALCTLPSTGIWTTLPAAGLLAVAVSFICRSRKIICLFMGVMPLLLNCLYGFSLSRAVFAGVVCFVMAWLCILAKRAVITARKSRSAGERTVFCKSLAVLICSLVGTVAVWLACFGNPISAQIAGKSNARAVSEQYGEAVQTKSTYYDAFTHRYLTQIDFSGADGAQRYYYSAAGRDDYGTYCLEKLTEDAADYFERMTTLESDSVYVRLDREEVPLSADTDYTLYLDRFEYLLPVTVTITDAADFYSVVTQMLRYLTLSDSFVYRSITLAANGTDETPYLAYLSSDGALTYYIGDEDFYASTAAEFPDAVR